jgi:DNA-binding CsgD family transcriptional regulator
MVHEVMVWLDGADLQAIRTLGRELDLARTPIDLRRTVLTELVRLVPSDVSSWNRIALATGEVEHQSVPSAAEPPGAFDEVAPTAGAHPLLHAHAVRPRPAVRLSDTVEPCRLERTELYGELLHRSSMEYGISIGVRPQAGEAVVIALGRHERQFSERDRDVLNLSRPAVEQALLTADARERLLRAMAAAPPPGTAVVLLDDYGEIEQSSAAADRSLAEHFGAAEHPGWLPAPVASWLALPPRPPLVSMRDGRRLIVRLLPGDPHALLLEEVVDSFRPDSLQWLGVTPREREVLDAARAIQGEAEIADELFLSLHAVRQRLARVEEKLGVRTVSDAIASALRASV